MERMQIVPNLCPGKRIWQCGECGRFGNWGQGWMWFGSYADMDEGNYAVTCSDKCRRTTRDVQP